MNTVKHRYERSRAWVPRDCGTGPTPLQSNELKRNATVDWPLAREAAFAPTEHND